MTQPMSTQLKEQYEFFRLQLSVAADTVISLEDSSLPYTIELVVRITMMFADERNPFNLTKSELETFSVLARKACQLFIQKMPATCLELVRREKETKDVTTRMFTNENMGFSPLLVAQYKACKACFIKTSLRLAQMMPDFNIDGKFFIFHFLDKRFSVAEAVYVVASTTEKRLIPAPEPTSKRQKVSEPIEGVN